MKQDRPVLHALLWAVGAFVLAALVLTAYYHLSSSQTVHSDEELDAAARLRG